MVQFSQTSSDLKDAMPVVGGLCEQFSISQERDIFYEWQLGIISHYQLSTCNICFKKELDAMQGVLNVFAAE